jgi:two-component system LytT family response regulator
MNALIIEDEAPAARRLHKLLDEGVPPVRVLHTLESVKAAVQWLSGQATPDLIFMDVHLSDGLCFEIFRQTLVEAPVIFTTAYDQYALQAFKVNSVDYLLKPVTAKDLAAALDKYQRLRQGPGSLPVADAETLLRTLLRQQEGYRTRILVEHRDKYLRLDVEQVAYFYSENKLTHLVTGEGKVHVVDPTLEELEKQLHPRQFFRVSRQLITSARAIGSIHKYFNGKLKITLRPPAVEEVVLSREKAQRFREWLDG